MKRYYLFYHPRVLGDVLLVMFDSPLIATHWQRVGDAIMIYHEDRLIGVNLFDVSSLIKIHASGIIYNPPPLLIKIINDKFSNDGVDVYLPHYESGFVIGSIQSINNDEKSKTLMVDIGTRTVTVMATSHDYSVGQQVVIALPGTLLPNGTVVTATSTITAQLCYRGMFENNSSFGEPLSVNKKQANGTDYFQWE